MEFQIAWISNPVTGGGVWAVLDHQGDSYGQFRTHDEAEAVAEAMNERDTDGY